MYLDPRSRDYAIRTVFGEAFNDPSEEAVAHVIRNRTVAGRYGGKDVPSVVLARNQFEPWNNAEARARMQGLSPDSPEYQRLGALVDRTWSGDVPDPTSGATHFYAPKAQSAFGRATPQWGREGGQQIGAHMFFAPEGRVTREGDAEGPPSVMTDAFSGVKKEMNPMNYALQQGQPVPQPQAQPAALSAKGMFGGGALNESNWGGLINKTADTDLGNALERASLYLRDDPKALGALSGLKKNADDDNIYTISRDPDTGSIFKLNRRTGQITTERDPNFQGAKVPPTAIKAVTEDVGKLAQLHTSSEHANKLIDMIDKKQLDTGLFNRGKAAWENLTGQSSESTVALNEFDTFKSRVVNDILLMHKGVQTEGDAQRAANQFLTGLAGNDTKSARAALDRLIELNGKLIQTQGPLMLDPYKSRYNNPGVFAPYDESLKRMNEFYSGRKPSGAPAGERPPLSSFSR